MSVQAMAWVLECATEITDATSLLIMLSIANHANEHGQNSWPGINTIANEARCSRATVQRRLRELADEGHVGIETQAGGTWDQPANRRPNRYTLVNFRGYSQGPHVVTPQASQGSQNPAQGPQNPDSGVSPADTQTVLNHPTKRAADFVGQELRDPDCVLCGGSGVTESGAVCECFQAKAGVL